MQSLNRIAMGALIAAYALGPLATQIVTPAVPLVHHDLSIPMAVAQLLVSLAFVVIAASTLLYGPLSDRLGRRPVLLFGTTLFCVGSLAAAVAPDAAWLVAGRCLQSAGSAATLALTRTVIHDIHGRERSTRVLAQLTTVMVFVPMLAPVAGGLLLDAFGWRSVFGACLVAGFVVLPLLWLSLPESRAPRVVAPDTGSALGIYRYLLADRAYRAPALHFALVMAAVFSTQAAIPYLIIDVIGGSATEYGVWFAIACLAYVGGNQFTARWGGRFDARRLIRVSGLGCLASSLLGVSFVLGFGVTTASLFVPTIVLYFFAALGIAPVQAEAVAAQPSRSGAASGLLTAIQMLVGAAAVQAIGYAHDGTTLPLFVTLLACTSGAILAYRGEARRTDVQPAGLPREAAPVGRG